VVEEREQLVDGRRRVQRSRETLLVRLARLGRPCREDRVDQRTFLRVEPHHLLLDRPDRHQPIDRHGLGLAESVGSVRGLVFDRRIPPRVEMNHVRRLGQVDAEARGLQGQQEKRHRTRLERRDQLRTSRDRRLSVQVQIGDPPLVQRFPHQGQMGSKLTKYQSPLTFRRELREQLQQARELRGGHRARVVLQAGVTGQEAQPRERREHLDAALPILLFGLLFSQIGERREPGVFVPRPLVVRHRHRHLDLGARGQVGRDGELGPTEEERCEHSPQRVRGGAVVLFFDRQREPFTERRPRPEQGREDHREQAPELPEVVFHRRPRER
jgi:hypothetical protein